MDNEPRAEVIFRELTPKDEAKRQKRTNEVVAELRRLWGAEPTIEWHELAKYDIDGILLANKLLREVLGETKAQPTREKIQKVLSILEDTWESYDEFGSILDYA